MKLTVGRCVGKSGVKSGELKKLLNKEGRLKDSMRLLQYEEYCKRAPVFLEVTNY